MEPRKSILETVTPSDALGKLSARNSSFRVWALVAAVLVLFGIVFIVASIISNTGGTGTEPLPSVSL